jgi:hypothetical protein
MIWKFLIIDGIPANTHEYDNPVDVPRVGKYPSSKVSALESMKREKKALESWLKL